LKIHQSDHGQIFNAGLITLGLHFIQKAPMLFDNRFARGLCIGTSSLNEAHNHSTASFDENYFRTSLVTLWVEIWDSPDIFLDSLKLQMAIIIAHVKPWLLKSK